MQLNEVIDSLKKMGNPRAVEIWTDFGIKTTDQYYGVQLTELKEFAKKIKKNHALSLELWNSGVHDARLLATMIEEPKKVTPEQMDDQVLSAHTPDLVDRYCSNVVGNTAFARQKAEQWTPDVREMVKRAGFMLLVQLAKNSKDAEDAFFEAALSQIAREIGGERNWVKEAMNYALIAIGSRNRNLNGQAAVVAQSIGKVHVDYGKTSCQVPDAVAVLNSEKLHAKL